MTTLKETTATFRNLTIEERGRYMDLLMRDRTPRGAELTGAEQRELRSLHRKRCSVGGAS